MIPLLPHQQERNPNIEWTRRILFIEAVPG
jgi:hypothetical protein